MRLRKLNERGIESFASYLSDLRNGGTAPAPEYLLVDSQYSKAVQENVSIDNSRVFEGKFEFAEYLAVQLRPVLINEPSHQDAGLWSWLALCYFDLICPAGRDGTRRVWSNPQYILSKDRTNYYRHLVRTPCLLYHIHGKCARPLVASKPDRHGEAAEAFASRQHLFGSRPLFEVLDKLYISEVEGSWGVKRGARGKNAGSMRRLGKIMKQFDLTYDFLDMGSEEILAILPREFERYRASTPSQ